MDINQVLKRTFCLLFAYSDRWYNKYLPGYTHVAVFEVVGDLIIGLNPLSKRCLLDAGWLDDELSHKWPIALKVIVLHPHAQLIKPTFQTCATFVQYVMGINTGAILCQTLYDRLLNRKYDGIEVSVWQKELN